MPILFILTIAVQIYFAIHAARHGHAWPWIFIILSFPMIGCLIYAVMVMGPELQHAGQKAAGSVQKMLDPDRDFRAKLRQAEMVGSADAKRHLAEECMKLGRHGEAVELFEAAATGIHADDPALLHGLARARFSNGDPLGAQRALDDLRRSNPDWSSADAHLLYARSLEEQGKTAEAMEEYEAVVSYYPGEEARCRMALLLQKDGRVVEARNLFQTVMSSLDGAPKHYRRAQNDWLQVARRNLGA